MLTCDVNAGPVLPWPLALEGDLDGLPGRPRGMRSDVNEHSKS